MRKIMTVGILLLAGALLLAAAPAVQAGSSMDGKWAGKWECTPPGCEKPGGAMHGNINQSGNHISGNFTMENTVLGTVNGSLNGTATGTHLQGSLSLAGRRVTVDANQSGNTIHGNFNSDELGAGTFTINRQ